jgi:hypothetical protein
MGKELDKATRQRVKLDANAIPSEHRLRLQTRQATRSMEDHRPQQQHHRTASSASRHGIYPESFPSTPAGTKHQQEPRTFFSSSSEAPPMETSSQCDRCSFRDVAQRSHLEILSQVWHRRTLDDLAQHDHAHRKHPSPIYSTYL